MRTAVAVAAAVAILGTGACTSRRVQQMPVSALESAVIAKGVSGPEQEFAATEAAESFAPDVPEVLAWVRVKNISKALAMRWLWYAPDDTLYYDSGEIVVQPTALYHPFVAAWQSLPVARWQAAELPGQWRVVIQLNQAELATLRFQIEPRPPQVIGNRGKNS